MIPAPGAKIECSKKKVNRHGQLPDDDDRAVSAASGRVEGSATRHSFGGATAGYPRLRPDHSP